MDDRRNKIIVGSVIVIVVVTIVAFVFFSGAGSAKCDLIEGKPEFKAENLKNISSGDYKSLANFDGFLTYTLADAKEKKVYLPLQLQSIASDSKDASIPTLTLQADCAKVTFTMRTDQTTGTSVTKIEVELSHANDKSTKCQITDVGDLGKPAPVGKHYKCQTARLTTFDCKDGDKTIARLQMNDIEFEINGNSDNIKKGEFSTPAIVCAP